MVGRKETDTAERVAQFIQYFDGDLATAKTALEAYANTPQRLTPRKPHGKSLITITDLSKVHRRGRQTVSALTDTSLTIYQGEFVAITGPSGSGKSTLLQLIGGLDKPTGGTITVNGQQLAALNDRQLSRYRAQTVGFVFQFFYLQPFLKLRTNLAVAALFGGLPAHVRAERISELAETVGITERLDHYPKELSGGQMQRTAIARALINRPQIILADEPTGNLDSKNSQAIVDLFETVRQTYGTTIVLVTHDYGIAARADRTIAMKDGTII